jgi:hypothetical protein
MGLASSILRVAAMHCTLLTVLCACGAPPAATVPVKEAPQGATAPAKEAPPLPRLRFIDDLNLPTGIRFEGVEVGGLSGLFFRSTDRKLLALSDDRAERGPARVYEISLAIAEQLDVTITGVVALTGPAGPFEVGRVDPEGLSMAPGGGMLFSTEGDTRPDPRIAPRIHHVGDDGSHLGLVPLPDAFLPEPSGQQTKGVRFNKGLESLSTAPSGRWTYAANEQALIQDGEISSFDAGTLVRLLRYDAQLSLVSEHRYLTDAVPAAQGEVREASLGVSDIVALDDARLLVMERAFVATTETAHNRIRLYLVDLAAQPEGLLRKELVLDLDDVVPQLEAASRRLDNLEGLALGPRLSNGQRTLVLVSDNNFKQQQRTLLIAFAIEE